MRAKNKSKGTDADPPTSHAIADGWANFAETVLPTIGGVEHAEAHVAFHFGALYLLQLIKEIVESGSAERGALALHRLEEELEEFMREHAISLQ